MLTLTLMDHNFEIPCEASEQERLIEAATLLEDKLDQLPELKGEGKVLMVALNLCYDYLQLKEDTTQYTQRVEQQLETAINHIAESTHSDTPNR
ncbi:MAG: cell division protein ZapA [Thiomicrorhabdus sp.]|nr:cell division protein ZapA [Thiomicrorhabdus sp.]